LKKLRHLYAADDDTRILAAERQETWQNAIAAYCARRKKSLEAEYATKASFDRSQLRAQARALPTMLELLTQGVMEIPDTPAVIERQDGESSDDHLIRLAALLTPPGWDAHIRPKLQARRAEAMTSCFAEKDEEENAALIIEIDHLLRFLSATDTQAAGARAQRRGKLARDSKALQRHEAAM
jgi:hypothetical protein